MMKAMDGRIMTSVCVHVLLLFLGLVLLRAVIKQLLVHLHEELEGVVDQAMDSPKNSEHVVTAT